jgi:hypothetical protein
MTARAAVPFAKAGGLHLLGDRPVARIAAVIPGTLVPFIAEVSVESEPRCLGEPTGPSLQILRMVVAPKDSGIPETGCRANHWKRRRPRNPTSSLQLVHFCDIALSWG